MTLRYTVLVPRPTPNLRCYGHGFCILRYDAFAIYDPVCERMVKVRLVL